MGTVFAPGARQEDNPNPSWAPSSLKLLPHYWVPGPAAGSHVADGALLT